MRSVKEFVAVFKTTTAGPHTVKNPEMSHPSIILSSGLKSKTSFPISGPCVHLGCMSSDLTAFDIKTCDPKRQGQA